MTKSSEGKKKSKQSVGKGKEIIETKDTKGKRKVLFLEDEEEENRMDVDVDESERDGGRDGTQSGSDDDESWIKDNVSWKGEAYITGVNYHAKKMIFLLFINRPSLSSLYLFLVIDFLKI